MGALLIFAAALGGCGLKGALYLPEKTDVTIRPAPAEASPAAPTEPAAPETQPTPAPQTQDPPSGEGSG
jgi:predicted small lipoprotein YifL